MQFRAALRETRERIETAALDTAEPQEDLRPIISARINELNLLLAKIDRLPETSGPGFKKQGGAR